MPRLRPLPPLERWDLDGPAGLLEARLERPEEAPRFSCVFGHPHPLHGGTMQNNVVVHSARALTEAGGAVARFNFRGVGRSEGASDGKGGESADMLCVIEEVIRRLPGLPLLVGGFSFGSIRAMECCEELVECSHLGVAPPITLEHNRSVPGVAHPSAVILAGDDEVVVPRPDEGLLAGLYPDLRRLEVVPGAGHLFEGRLDALREAVLRCAASLPLGPERS